MIYNKLKNNKNKRSGIKHWIHYSRKLILISNIQIHNYSLKKLSILNE